MPHFSVRNKLVLFERECDCEPGRFFANGRAPEYYTDFGRAFKAQHEHYLKRHVELYWGVHLNGKHVLGIVGED